MKTQYRNMLWLAALPLAFAMGACQNEEIAEAGQSVNVEGKTVLRATMGSYNAPQSRAQVELGNTDESQEVFMWNTEDAFMVYNQEDPTVSSLFTISGYDEANPSAEATFVGEGKISEGTKVTAIYPAPDASAVQDGVVTLAFSDPYGTSVGDNSEWMIRDYMMKHMFMYATATIEGANSTLTFHHLCAMARVSYTNASGADQNISEVMVGTGTNCMNNSMTFNLKDNTYEVNDNSASVRLTFNDLTVASGRTVDFYLLFIPSGNSLGNSDVVRVRINDMEVTMPASDITSQKFEAGKRYWFNVMQTKADGLIWKKDAPEVLITNYLRYLCRAFIVTPVPRYDIHGKRIFEQNYKYYFADHGLRNLLCGFNLRGSIEKVMENVIYQHLVTQGFKVSVGILRNGEVDFVATRGGQTIYVQATYLLGSEETIEREFGNLTNIRDNYPKYVISMDPVGGELPEYPGINHVRLREFLRMKV